MDDDKTHGTLSVEDILRAKAILDAAEIPDERCAMIVSWGQAQRLGMSREDFEAGEDMGDGLRMFTMDRR